MRLSAICVLLVLAVAACGDDDSEPPASTRSDAEPTCQQWTQRPVTDQEVRNGCSVKVSDDPLAYEQKGTAVHECEDGRILYWNDAGWGYTGEPMTPHADRAELVAPEAERSACPA